MELPDFYINKYSPKNKADFVFNTDLYDKVIRMGEDSSIPHTIFYGDYGSGKKTFVSLLLRTIYGDSVDKTHNHEYKIKCSGNKETKITIKQSEHHIIIEPEGNNSDRYIIQEIVNQYVPKIPITRFAKGASFKTIVINNIDNLAYYAQASLRRTMEIYSSSCRFIMWGRSPSKIIDAIRSRCYMFKVPSPEQHDIFFLLALINRMENLNLSYDTISKISENASNNVRVAMWELYMHSKQFGEVNVGMSASYNTAIKYLVKCICHPDLKKMDEIRAHIHNILITNIEPSNIIKKLYNELIISNDITENTKLDISQIMCNLEYMLVKSRRTIYHMERVVLNLMHLIWKQKKAKSDQELKIKNNTLQVQ